ncbi:TetR family transcriptional regulator [Streptomyces globisporus C-1027]|uniref:TetR family transcriptional regulator n=1 Tax=Streptomyces globisporus C-1027 TaxID=1172567 RepID=A0A0U2SP85_STRGL|nr:MULTISPECIES: TetR family transcriptional regulator [Streptomyces]ALU92064.1 TetR family transcriptional regulator [Streptomyces globisporus C-1027]OKJ24988.1 TetR family transcriptional regulator [Streptomyces sp. CB02130]
MTTSPTDGRLLKGELRRQELIEATLQVVAREGVAGVSHRAVAREANQPAAAYYFKSIDDLLTAALTVCVDQDAERMRRLAESADGSREGLTALAELLASVMGGPGPLLAEYELYLPAARRPELRTSTGRWLDAIAGYAPRYTDDPVRVQTFKGVIDGLLLQGLLTDTPPTAAEFEAVLRHVLL